MTREKGFTLVELLVVILIVMVLAGLSFESATIYKRRAYESVEAEMMSQARIALEAGKIDSEQFPNEVMTVNQSVAGPVTGETAELLLPALVLPDQFRLFVQHNPGCSEGICIQDFIEARHCKIDTSWKFVTVRNQGSLIQVISERAVPSFACGS